MIVFHYGEGDTSWLKLSGGYKNQGFEKSELCYKCNLWNIIQ